MEFERRVLAESEEPVRVDYSVLSVLVMTLGLIMIVEVIRHKMDHIAAPRPFSKAVLQRVYSELATLGIVELFLYMLSNYYADLDKQKYVVFADIHFALFYTAILNAFQSVILAIVSHRVARRIWVETEMLELSHYVEIREEFELVKAAMQRMGTKHNTGSGERSNDRSGSMYLESQEKRNIFRRLANRLPHPALRRKYNDLLLQVRFHELRVHFLQSYNLPLMLKISDYLLLSQQQVLLKLVHVSSIAWTLLTGAVNVLYYVLGLVSYKVADSTIVGTALIWIFFWSMGIFVLVAAAVRSKMKSIFKKIMIEKTLWGVKHQQENRDHLRNQQLDLFWGSDPKLVIAAIQFMQFGYAVTLSVVIVFWEDIDDGSIPMVSYLLVITVCYTVFVFVTARVIPQYTMCTSLGQLVDEKRLHETLAEFVLSESRRNEAERMLTEHFPESLVASKKMPQDNILNQVDRLTENDPSATKTTQWSSRIDSSSLSNHSDAALMAELVKLDTSSLRMNLPAEARNQMECRQYERENRRGRRKCRSEGVAAMVNLSVTDFSSRPNQVKDDSFISELDKLRNVSSFEPIETLKAEDTLQESLRRRRRSHRRLKTMSDGVATMSKLQTGDTVNLPSPVRRDFINQLPSSLKVDLEDPTLLGDKEASQALIFDAIERVSNNAEADSVQSDDGHSDFGDVPEVEPRSGFLSLPVPAATIKMRFENYILSKKYAVLSNVFGTLVAFFFVGQRVESFLHSEGIVSEKFVSFDFDNEHTFWALFGLFSLFCVVDCAIMVILNPFKQQNRSIGEKKAFIAGLLDFLLMSMCLFLLIIAEVKRCCTENEPNRLASERVSSNVHEYESRLPVPQDNGNSVNADYYNVAATCSCPPFGFRQYGGLGTIEPYTAFVGLRIFRHWAAGIITKKLSSEQGKSQSGGVIKGISFDPFAVFDDSTGNEKSLGASQGMLHAETQGTAAELWKAAIGEHPEVAQKYGEFSCEILKIMLGISFSNSGICKDLHRSSDSPNKDSRDVVLSDDLSTSFELGEKYARLAPEAQEVILAGKLGRTVKHATRIFGSTQGSIPEDEEALQPNSLVFTLDLEASHRKLASAIAFRSPHAQLVRSMRRCDRKLLPILNKWAVVDVVLTRFEIVYFDASNADEGGMGNEAVKEALVATKGGKGLRLCDVAEGRRMVGRLDISDIECLTLERYFSEAETPGEDNDGPVLEIQKVEYWKEAPLPSGVRFPRASRWCQIKQDQLHIKTNHGRTLCLRFYSDLEDAEHGPRSRINRDVDGAEFYKNNAFQWAQTIGRFCGKDQLKQNLPHFGDSTDDELRDYLVEHRKRNEDVENIGRRRSTGDLLARLARKPNLDSSVDAKHRSFRMSFSRFPSFRDELDRAICSEGGLVEVPELEDHTHVQSLDGYFNDVQSVEGEPGDATNATGSI